MPAVNPSIPTVDPLRRKSSLAELATKIALTKPGTWFYSRVAARIDSSLMRVSRGRLSSAVGLFPIVLLSARGARSGIERTPGLYQRRRGRNPDGLALRPAEIPGVVPQPQGQSRSAPGSDGAHGQLHGGGDRGSRARAAVWPGQARLPRLRHL